MDVGIIVYTTELEAPALKQTARRILEAEAAVRRSARSR
jgi:hypothetical protein